MYAFLWFVLTVSRLPDGLEPTDRLVPKGWVGNPWGPDAKRARETGEIPPLKVSPSMSAWDQWGKKVLRDGDVLFRRGDSRIVFGTFPFSKFLANTSGSQFSHTGIVAIEGGTPVVYDTTKAGVRRQPFSVWTLDNVGAFGVKRPKPEYAPYIKKALAFCRNLWNTQAPFDYDLHPDDRAFYCVEMTEKAYRSSGLPLAEPVLLGDMENVGRHPIIIMLFLKFSPLRLDQPVYFPGNERHGIWSSKKLDTIYVTPPASPSTSGSSAGKP